MIERRKQWDGSCGATVRTRFTAPRNQLGLDLAELHEDGDAESAAGKARDIQDRLLEILASPPATGTLSPTGRSSATPMVSARSASLTSPPCSEEVARQGNLVEYVLLILQW